MRRDGDSSDDRERYEELLSEIRVMLPGVEVLFAFLLTSVFASRFEAVDLLGKAVFMTSLVCAAVTVLLLTVPALLHRLSDLTRARRTLLATRFQLAGSVFLGISVTSGLFVVVRFVFSGMVASLVSGALAVTWIGLWYVYPMLLGRRTRT